MFQVTLALAISCNFLWWASMKDEFLRRYADMSSRIAVDRQLLTTAAGAEANEIRGRIMFGSSTLRELQEKLDRIDEIAGVKPATWLTKKRP
jgi:hypothetical protein